MFRKKKAYVTRVEKGHSHAILKNYMANKLAVVAAVVLILTGLLCMKLGFLAQEREERETKGRHGCGKITRNHARNDEYPALPERSSRGA